jgi:hypothetical protein
VSFPFNAQQGVIIIPADVFGIIVRLALDTGATASMMHVAPLVTIGYDPSLAPDRVQVTTGSGVEYVPRISIDRIKTLGQERT